MARRKDGAAGPRTPTPHVPSPQGGGEGLGRSAGADSGAACRIIPNKNRRLQIAPTRRKLFDDAAKSEFLEWFAATCNASLSARKAGFHYRTVIRHWREDPVFGERVRGGLADGLSAARGAGAARGRGGAEAGAAAAREGERPPPPEHFRMDPMTAVQLLREHKKHLAGLPGGSGRGAKPGASLKAMSFDEAITLLDKKLRALGARHGVEPGEAGNEAQENGAGTGLSGDPAG